MSRLTTTTAPPELRTATDAAADLRTAIDTTHPAGATVARAGCQTCGGPLEFVGHVRLCFDCTAIQLHPRVGTTEQKRTDGRG